MNKKQIIKKILSAFTISTFIMGAISPLYTVTKASSVNYSALAMLLGAEGMDTGIFSMKLSKYVSYSYMQPENIKVLIQCRAGNDESRYPEEGNEGTYMCVVRSNSSNVIFTNPSQTRNVTFKAAGKTQNVTFSFPYQVATINPEDGGKIEQNVGQDGSMAQSIDVNIKIKVPPKTVKYIMFMLREHSDLMNFMK